jgi:hypothetical protein
VGLERSDFWSCFTASSPFERHLNKLVQFMGERDIDDRLVAIKAAYFAGSIAVGRRCVTCYKNRLPGPAPCPAKLTTTRG